MKRLTNWRKALSRFEYIHDQQSDDQCDRRNDFEIEKRFAAKPSKTPQISNRSNTMDDGAKDNRADHHFDQRDKAIAKRLKLLSEIGKEIADGDTQQDRQDRLDVKDFVPRFGGAYDRVVQCIVNSCMRKHKE